MKWEEKSIAMLIERAIDYRGKTPTKSDFGIKLVTAKIIKNGRISFDGPFEYIKPETYDEVMRRGIPQMQDILITTEAPLGEVAIIKTDEVIALAQRVILLRINKQVAEPEFVYQALKTPLMQGRLYARATGTTVLGIKNPELRKVEIPTPPLPTQRKIASILSAYDDLIENNLKRIKLLEEKAQLHYKELMQEMSYSKTKREECIKDCLAFYIGGGWGEEVYKEKFTEGAYVIRGTDIPNIRIGNISGVPLRFHKESNLASRKIQIGDIVFEVSNGQINNIGRTVLVSQRLLGQFDKPVMCASFAKLIRVNEKLSPEFFYLYLNEGQENGLLYQYKSNSANGINNFAFETFIDEVKITIPKEIELKAFTEKVKPIFTLISTLGEQNSKLSAARDILLPKLMNGQIEVYL
jgi:type I restriction enzyme S subunit